MRNSKKLIMVGYLMPLDIQDTDGIKTLFHNCSRSVAVQEEHGMLLQVRWAGVAGYQNIYPIRSILMRFSDTVCKDRSGEVFLSEFIQEIRFH